MAALDARLPGLRFRVIDEQDRIRPHMRLFVGVEMARTLETPVAGADEGHILLALKRRVSDRPPAQRSGGFRRRAAVS